MRATIWPKATDKVSIFDMHNQAKVLSLEQRRQKQFICILYIHKANNNVRRV